MILNIARMVPRGLVVFVPSYTFLEAVKDIWQECGVLTRLQKQKQVRILVVYDEYDFNAQDRRSSMNREIAAKLTRLYWDIATLCTRG